MPIYEFRCRSCSAEFEELLLGSRLDATVRCPKCGAPEAERLFSAFAVGAGHAAPEPGPCGACGAPERGACRWEG